MSETEIQEQWQGQIVNGELHLLRYLGGSDHSAVYLTEYGEPEPRQAAIKLIPADPATAALQLARWERAARLSHAHLLRLIRTGRCELGGVELLYVVMDYAPEDLSQVLPERALTPQEAREMLEPVLDTLAYLHGQGFVHGRLKPANILAANDQLKISSDGLCRIGEPNSDPGQRSVYDPPEVSSGAVSPAGDVWSLGMTLAEVLTQRLPVVSGTGDPELPAGLAEPFPAIVRHCLRRDPQRRWSVPEIAAWLRQPAPAVQEPPRVPVATPASPRKSRALVPAVATGLAVVLLLAAPRFFRRPPDAAPTPLAQPSSAPAEPAPRPAPPVRSQPTARAARSRVVPGEVMDQVLPTVPRSASNTIRGTIRVDVRVGVDPSGDVSAATLELAGPSRYFANLALQAARRWKFRPAQLDGRSVSSEWLLRFSFTREATRVSPQRAAS
ncbi:MAG TPA: TonB family protein [Terriglobia bacterium]